MVKKYFWTRRNCSLEWLNASGVKEKNYKVYNLECGTVRKEVVVAK